MNFLSSIPAVLEILVPVLVGGTYALQRFKEGLSDSWHEEAEAQQMRADRLADQVAALTEEVKALRAENAELQALVRRIDPEHLGTSLGGEE